MKTRVVAFGTFDLLHPGHIAFLTAARKLGDELVVVVTRDDRVFEEKGMRPLFSEKERLQIITALAVVSQATLGDPVGSWGILKRLKPQVVALGHDQKPGPQAIRALKLLPSHPILKRIRRAGPVRHTSRNIKRLIYDRQKTAT